MMQMHVTALAPALAGHNQPPSPLELAKDVMTALAEFLEEEPVIQSDEVARKAKVLVDRAKVALDEIEDDRDRRVRPLNEQVKGINASAKEVTVPFNKILDVLKARLTAFLKAEEDKRIAAATAARLAAEEAVRLAREAEAKEAEALENAAVGEIGVDVASAVYEADAAFNDAGRALRAASRADNAADNVRLVGGFGRSLSMRTKETLVLIDADKAIKAVGITPKIEEAILSAARDYRKLKGQLPEGVKAETERAL